MHQIGLKHGQEIFPEPAFGEDKWSPGTHSEKGTAYQTSLSTFTFCECIRERTPIETKQRELVD